MKNARERVEAMTSLEGLFPAGWSEWSMSIACGALLFVALVLFLCNHFGRGVLVC